MDNGCNLNNACPKAGLTTQPESKYSACTKKQQAPEDVDGCKFISIFPRLTMLIHHYRAQGDAVGRNGHQGIETNCIFPIRLQLAACGFFFSPHVVLGSYAVIGGLFNMLAGR
jgi:hypothetical protein